MRNWVAGIRNVLVLAALVGAVLLSWLLGHVLRYSIPSLWHPPIQETDPQIRTGEEFDPGGIRRLVEFPAMAPANLTQVQVFLPDLPFMSSDECQGYTYYTSLPAKCQTADGRWVKVGGSETNVVLIPQGK